jgi:hypothetical protein
VKHPDNLSWEQAAVPSRFRLEFVFSAISGMARLPYHAARSMI